MISKKSNRQVLDDRGSSSLYAVIGIVLVAVIGVVIWIASGSFSNFVNSTFSKPEKYLAYVENKVFFDKRMGLYERAYQSTKAQTKNTDIAYEEDIQLKVGENGKKYLTMAKAVGLDLSWLDSVGMQYLVNSKDGDLDLKTAFLVNEKTIFSPEILMIAKEGSAFIGVSELSDTYFKMDVSDSINETLKQNAIEKYKKMQEARPSYKEGKNLVSKYLKLILEQVTNVEKSKNIVLEGSQVTQKCTQLKITLKDEDLRKIYKTVCRELYKDEEVKKIIEDYCKAEELDFEEIYEDFQDDMEERQEDADEIGTKIEQLTIDLYLDGNSNVIGRIYEIKPVFGEKMVVKLLTPMSKKEIGFEFSYQSGEKSASLSGTGKRTGDKVSGDYVLKVQGKKILLVNVEDLDLKALEKMQLKGRFKTRFSEDVDLKEYVQEVKNYSEELYGVLYYLAISMKPQLELVLDVEKEKHTVEIGLLDDTEDVFRLCFQGGKKKVAKVSVPAKVVDSLDDEAFSAYIEGWNWNGIAEALGQAGAPSEYQKTVQQYSDIFLALPRYLQKSRAAKDQQILRGWHRSAIMTLGETSGIMNRNETYVITISEDSVSVVALNNAGEASELQEVKDFFCQYSSLQNGCDFARSMFSAAGKDIKFVTITIDRSSGDVVTSVTNKTPEKYQFDEIRN